MFLKKVSSSFLYLFRKQTFIFLLLFFSFISPSKAGECIPRDHMAGYISEGGLGNLVDVVIGLISNELFGKLKNLSFDSYINFVDRDWENGMVYRIFMSITQDARFQVVFYLCVVLLISYLGASFAMGYSKLSTNEIVAQFIKIGVVVFFTTPTGWDIYFELIVKNVLEASRYFNRAIIASMYNVSIDKVTTPFQPINMVIDIVLNGDTWTKVGAIFFSQGFLFASLILVVMVYAVVTVIIILAKAAILYIATIIASSVLLSIGPIFGVCLLFEKTKEFFNKWITNLIGLFMQQYILFLGFFIFCVIIASMIKGLFYFETCHGPVLQLVSKVPMPKFLIDVVDNLLSIINKVTFGLVPKVNLPKLIMDLRLNIFSAQVPTAPVFDLPSNIFSVASVFVVTTLFGKFIDIVSEIGTTISGATISAAGMMKDEMGALTKAQDKVDSTAREAAVGAMMGGLITKPIRLLADGKDALDQKIKSREKEGKKGWLTKGLKGLSYGMKPLAAPGKALDKVLPSKKKIERMRAIEKNQHIAKKKMQEEIAKRVGEGKAYSDVSQLNDNDRAEIKKAVKDEVMSKGVPEVRGEKVTEEFAEDVMTTELQRVSPIGASPFKTFKETVSPNLNIDDQAYTKTGRFGSRMKRYIKNITRSNRKMTD